jgi:hypothetical protein
MASVRRIAQLRESSQSIAFALKESHSCITVVNVNQSARIVRAIAIVNLLVNRSTEFDKEFDIGYIENAFFISAVAADRKLDNCGNREESPKTAAKRELEQKLIVNDSLNKHADARSIIAREITETWNKGEGEFRWKGRSSSTGNANSVTLDVSRHEMWCYLAEFTNLDNEYWAHPYFVVRLYNRSGQSLGKICFDTVAIPDEDAGNEPTAQDVNSGSRPRTVNAEAVDFVILEQGVWWSYFGNSNESCRNYM